MSDNAGIAPGWYPRPDMAGTQGYWDGEAWTEKVAPLPPGNAGTTRTSEQYKSDLRMRIGAAVIGLVMAMIGVGIGMSTAGQWIMILGMALLLVNLFLVGVVLIRGHR